MVVSKAYVIFYLTLDQIHNITLHCKFGVYI